MEVIVRSECGWGKEKRRKIEGEKKENLASDPHYFSSSSPGNRKSLPTGNKGRHRCVIIKSNGFIIIIIFDSLGEKERRKRKRKKEKRKNCPKRKKISSLAPRDGPQILDELPWFDDVG